LPFIAMSVFIWWKKRVLANLRSQMLDPITWRGDEHVLDVACGNGALLNGIATRVPQGRALGIDMWAEHSGGGNYESLWAHARLEKVADKIEFKEADARQLPFAGALFDVVTCSRAMHHIVRSQADFDQLIPELFRMLKPNGKIVILDIAHLVEACAARMKKVGMTYEVKDAGKFLSYEMKLVVGKK
jgi:ubiquinone/menaquinone biosynthesis C-methylase UbiE